jgi:hypothetical protein
MTKIRRRCLTKPVSGKQNGKFTIGAVLALNRSEMKRTPHRQESHEPRLHSSRMGSFFSG